MSGQLSEAFQRLKEISEIVYRTNDNVDTAEKCFYKIGPVTMGKLGDALHAVDKALLRDQAESSEGGKDEWEKVCPECRGPSNIDTCADCGLPELHTIHQDHPFYSSGCPKCNGTGLAPGEAPSREAQRPVQVNEGNLNYDEYVAFIEYADSLSARLADLEAKLKQALEDHDLRENFFNETCEKMEAKLEKMGREKDEAISMGMGISAEIDEVRLLKEAWQELAVAGENLDEESTEENYQRLADARAKLKSLGELP